MDEKRQKIILYTRWASIALVGVMAMFLLEKPFELEGAKEIVGAISDCFVVPGVVMAGLGGLTYISHLGGYDSFGYMFSNFSLHSLIPGKHPKKYKTFYEYKEKKDEKGRRWSPQLLFTGLASLGIGIVFLIVYALL